MEVAGSVFSELSKGPALAYRRDTVLSVIERKS